MTVLGPGVWPPLPPRVYVRRPTTRLPFPLRERSCSLFARARHGLWQGVQALRLGPGDEVLVPAYHHGSEIEALHRAGLGLRFYEATPTLEPDEGELESLLGPRVRALHLTHYLGFPQDSARWRAWCDARGLLLLEDAAQAWLASREFGPVGSLGDLAVFCLYKTFGLPDGAALLVRARAPGPDSRSPLGLVSLARRHALWLAAEIDGPARRADAAGPPSRYSPEEDFALGDPGTPPAAATLALLARVAEEGAAGRRRANYRLLLDDLAESVPAPFRNLPAGASPFAFPVESDRKDDLLARLARAGIRALDFWSVPHRSLPADRFPGAASRRARTVGLPVHQELDPEDVERIAEAVRGARRRRPPLRLERVDSVEAIQREWSELAQGSDNIFATWEWASTWWRHFGAGHPLLATACRSPSGRVLAVLPLYLFSSKPFRIVRLVGHGAADELGPLCAPEDRGETARALRRLLADVRADLFVAEQLPADEGWSAFLGGRALRTEGSPVLRFGASGWEDVLASWSPNLRQQVRRFERRLAREHELRYRLADDPARIDRDLDLLFALHTARWRGDSVFAGRSTTFQREFAALALERGWLRLWFLELDGRPVSAWYGFRFHGIESYYQAGRDPAWERHSVGLVLLAHSIRAAVEDGMREYRFLRGGEAFKYRFANADPGLETVGVARGAVGEAAVAASAAVPARFAPTMRRWLGLKAQATV